MMRSRALSVAFAVLLAVVLASPVLPRAEAADAGFVLTTLSALQENYVDRLSTVVMLNAALLSVEQRTGVAAFDGPIPPGVSDKEAGELFTQRFDEVYSLSRDRFSVTQLVYTATAGMLESLHDSHTGFIPPESYQEEKRMENGEAAFTGIGVVLLARDGRYYIREVFPNSPAARAGIRPFDRIVAVNGQSTSGRDSDEVSGLIRGPAGTTVVVSIERAGETTPLDLSMVRSPIHMPAVTSRMLDDSVGYLRIYEFLPGVGNGVRDAILALRRNGMRALVLDLRGNRGGLVDELRDVSAAMLPQSSPILQMTKRNGDTVKLETMDPPILPASIPVVALVDEGSASAAELLAAALQEQSRAVIAGTKTAGAVEVSINLDLPEGAGMQITVARLRSGMGERLEGHGVIPDAQEALETDAMNAGHDSQLDKALEVLRQKLSASPESFPIHAAVGGV